jgi:hypothetical protein
MDKKYIYKFQKEETYKIFEEVIGKPVSRIRFSPKTQTLICEAEVKD